MGHYRIGEAARRSGFSASALRYYEGIGLLTASARSEAGYRLYDDEDLTRLALIARAKQIGVSLEQAAELLRSYDGGDCEPVQRRMHTLATAEADRARRRVAELTDSLGTLAQTASRLSGPATSGPCRDGCACLAPEAPPLACSLDEDQLGERMADWRRVAARAVARERTPDGALRATFGDDVDVGQLARLAADERRCCAFLSFTLTVDTRGIALEVRGPEEAQEAVYSLFGAAA